MRRYIIARIAQDFEGEVSAFDQLSAVDG